MPDIRKLINETTESVFHGEIISLEQNLYKVQIGSSYIYASSAISESLYIGQLVVLGKTSGMYFIIGLGRATSKNPTIIEIRG